MIIDITGIELIPGETGINCPGNGLNPDIECCCDECDYMQCCLPEHDTKVCLFCTDHDCPHAGKQKSN